MTGKKLAAVFCTVILFIFGIYYTFIKHPPPDELLEINRVQHMEQNSFKVESYKSIQSNYVFNSKQIIDDSEEIDDKIPTASNRKQSQLEETYVSKIEESDLMKKQAKLWNEWIERNHLVSIGEFYNSCDSVKRVMIGRVLMIRDDEFGGVKSQSVVNITWDHEILDGKIFIDVNYNGNRLYNNKFELCTAYQKIIQCPLLAKSSNYIVDVKIPNYLPKGRYKTKAWMEDQNGEIIGCGFSEFTL